MELVASCCTPSKQGTIAVLGSPFQDNSQVFASSGTHVPRKVLIALQRAGAKISRNCGITLAELNGESLRVFVENFLSLLPEDADPLLSVADAASRSVDLEARSILSHYSALRGRDFHGNRPPLIAGPMLAPPTDVRFHHSTTALSAVPVCVADPPDLYPSIRAIPSGYAVCTLRQVWAGGTTIVFPVYRK